MVTVNRDPRVKVSLDEVSVARAGMTMAMQQIIKKIVIQVEYFFTIVNPHAVKQL
jgi:hypothetical protein